MTLQNSETMIKNNSIRILVVDDNEIIREYVRFILESENYSVDEACSGDDALSKCMKNEYGVIITDIRMPGKDGIATIKALRALHSNIRFIVMSGIDICNDLFETAAIFDADAVLRKPFTAHDLLYTIEQVQMRCVQ